LLQGLLDNVLSEYLWATAVLLTSPSVATVGLALTVKLATTLATQLPSIVSDGD
jgi:solute carrier family 35 protein F5